MKTIHILTLAALSCFSAPTFAADAAQMAQGQKIYETNCAACHGKKAKAEEQCSRPCSVPTTS